MTGIAQIQGHYVYYTAYRGPADEAGRSTLYMEVYKLQVPDERKQPAVYEEFRKVAAELFEAVAYFPKWEQEHEQAELAAVEDLEQ